MAVIETVRFRLADDADEQEFLRENANLEREYILQQPGGLSRETGKADDGEWLFVVHWSMVAYADASMSKFMDEPATQRFNALVAPNTFTMKRYELARA